MKYWKPTSWIVLLVMAWGLLGGCGDNLPVPTTAPAATSAAPTAQPVTTAPTAVPPTTAPAQPTATTETILPPATFPAEPQRWDIRKIRSLYVSPDGSRLYINTLTGTFVWNGYTMKLVSGTPGHGLINAFLLTPERTEYMSADAGTGTAEGGLRKGPNWEQVFADTSYSFGLTPLGWMVATQVGAKDLQGNRPQVYLDALAEKQITDFALHALGSFTAGDPFTCLATISQGTVCHNETTGVNTRLDTSAEGKQHAPSNNNRVMTPHRNGRSLAVGTDGGGAFTITAENVNGTWVPVVVHFNPPPPLLQVLDVKYDEFDRPWIADHKTGIRYKTTGGWLPPPQFDKPRSSIAFFQGRVYVGGEDDLWAFPLPPNN